MKLVRLKTASRTDMTSTSHTYFLLCTEHLISLPLASHGCEIWTFVFREEYARSNERVLNYDVDICWKIFHWKDEESGRFTFVDIAIVIVSESCTVMCLGLRGAEPSHSATIVLVL
jgi:hypothetical protein